MTNPNPQASDLTRGSVSRHLVAQTLPMFMGMATMIFAWTVETFYVGLLGPRELAAFSFTFPPVMGLSGIAMGLGTGAASLISRAVGAGEHQRVALLSTHSLVLTLLLTAVLGGVGFLFLEEYFHAIGAGADVMPLIRAFMYVYLASLPLFGLPMVANSVLRALGIARAPGLVLTGASLLSILVTPLFVFGVPGVPGMGLVGAAWSSVFTGTLRVLLMARLLVASGQLLHWRRGRWDAFGDSVRRVLQVGFPSILTSLIGPLSLSVVIGLLAAHGPEVVAGYGMASRIDMLATMLLSSLAASIVSFVGQNWGAGQLDRVHRGLKLSYGFSLAWGLFCAVLLAWLGRDIAGLVSDDPRVVESAAWFLKIVPVSFGMMGVSMVAGSCMIALGRPMPNLVMAVVRMALVLIPLAWLLDGLLGYVGVFCASAIASVLMGAVAWLWNRAILRRQLRQEA